jgi:tRNA(adenine34) deaminase
MTEDENFISRCIELSQIALDSGDAPFGSLVTKDGKILAEASNDKNTKTHYHAEILALNKAAKIMGTPDLFGCTLYTNCEPCPMCSFMIREHKIEKVVFALPSPFMGGFSKWNILEDSELNQFPPYFTHQPKVIASVLESDAKAVFDKTPLWMFGSKSRQDARFKK